MKAIKCRACGEEHWGLCVGAREFIDRKVANSPDLGDIEKTAPLILLDKCSDLRGLDKEKVPSRHGKYADKEKRNAYQREYMRKRRAGN